jgi:hypothetical protein
MIYAIRNYATSSIKFGFSRSPFGRLSQLQVGNEALLGLAGCVFSEKSFEKVVHRFLATERIRGEWYSGPLSEKVAAAFARVRKEAREDSRSAHSEVLRGLACLSEFSELREMLRRLAQRPYQPCY